MNSSEFQSHTEKIEHYVQRVNALADDDARSCALEMLHSLMELHGAGVARIVELAQQAGEPGRKLLDKLGADPLVCGLLVLYGVHPQDFESRVRHALQALQPRLRKKGGTVELLDITDHKVRLKIEASGHGCGSSCDAIEELIEQSILEAAPEVVEIVAESAAGASAAFIPLNQIQPAAKEEKVYEESAA